MKSFLLIIGISLFGQLSDSNDNRYPSQGQNLENSEIFGNANEGVSEQPISEYPQSSAEFAKPLPNQVVAKTQEANPSQLLETLAVHPESSELKGRPISLVESLLEVNSRESQTERVRLYWKLSNAVMQCDLARRELTEIATLQQSILQPGTVWTEVERMSQTNYQSKFSAARALQLRLQTELGIHTSDLLPLPSDQPLCGAYKTRYQELFENNPNAEAQVLDELIDWEYKNLQGLATSVLAARKWLDMVSAQRSPQSDGTELLQSYLSFSNSRRLFLQAIKDYNNHIVRYTQLATPGNVGTKRLVAMLIKTDFADWNQENIQRTSAEEGIESNTQPVVPRTFNEPGRNQSNRLPSDSNAEHSILVQ